MKSQTRADLAMTAAIAFLGAALVFSGFSLLRLHWGVRTMSPTLGLAELIGVAAAGIGIALLSWWCFALFCACLSAMAHKLGAHRLSAVTAAWSPAFMRRVVATVVGINLLAVPLAGADEAPGIDPFWHAGTVSTAPAVSGPGGGAGSVAGAGNAGGAGESVGTTSTAAGRDVLPPSPIEPLDPLWVPNAPDVDPDLLIRPSPRSNPAEGSGSGTSNSDAAPTADPEAGDVVVKSGDSLWGIVAEALGPYSTDVDVALAWPEWYRANRGTIGADPNLILPGQVLHAPGNR